MKLLDQSTIDAVVDPRAYASGQVDTALEEFRRDAPFSKITPSGFDPFWLVSKHKDLLEVERRDADFANGLRSTGVVRKGIERGITALTGEPNLIRTVVSVDGREHRALRGIIFPHVSPRSIRQMEAEVREIARRAVNSMLEKAPRLDFATDVAFLYPLRVIMSAMGIDASDEPFMLKLTQEIFSSTDPDLNRERVDVTPDQQLQALDSTMSDLESYFDEVAKRYRKNPGDNLSSLIANAKIDGDYLTRRQLMGYYIVMATAGHDTTSNALGGAFWILCERPDILTQLRSQDVDLGPFIEETLRWVTPVKHFMRTARHDTTLNGHEIAAGDWLMLSYHSANRDEEVFDRPFEFSLDRSPNRHVAFGYGPHVCLGQHLARLELRVFWEELLPKIASASLTGEPQRTSSNFVCGPKYLPVEITLK